jgi:tetratricopeptide (TPR) repeat protein
MGKRPLADRIRQLPENHKALLICLFLAVTTAAVYWQVGTHDFIHFDDDVYVIDNPHVNSGLKLRNIAWAFDVTSPEKKTYWHPLSWISHMVDCQLFELNPGGHHLMNLLFHCMNAVLLFLVLRRATGALWKSAVAAALFAFHPVNVDSVAWVAERKNLLSTFFWLLTMYAYIFYTEKTTIARYLLVGTAFILGLLSKPMLVTLPCVLLLMDYWPLRRIGFPLVKDRQDGSGQEPAPTKRISAWLPVVLEKIPLFAAALVTIYLSSLSLKSIGIVISTGLVPMGLRVSNAVVSYVLYLWKFIWPVHLTFFYPYPAFVPAWQVAASLALILIVSILALLYARKYPYLIVGWLWFIGTLVPVLGIMQGGLWPEIAERWAYVPYMGLFIAVTWGSSEAAGEKSHLKIAGTAVAGLVLALFILKICVQLPHWKNDFTFFQHAIDIDPRNYVAYANMGNAYTITGEDDRAISYFSKALEIKPAFALVHVNMGNILKNSGRYPEAEAHYREAVRIEPGNHAYHERLASILASQLKIKNAAREYRTALSLNPGSLDYTSALADMLLIMGDADQAAMLYRKVLEQLPTNYRVRTRLGNAYAVLNRLEDAGREYSEALQMNPDYQYASNGLVAVTLRKNRIDEQLKLFESRLEASPQDMNTVYKLAVLHAGKGDFDKALFYLNEMAGARPNDPDVFYNIACIKARQNKADEAVSSLRTAVDKGFKRWDMLRGDKDLNNIRETEYYKEMVRKNP